MFLREGLLLMGPIENLRLMSQYNQLMNQKIYQLAQKLGTEVKCDRGAFFGSLFGTLNHIYVADLIWLWRFATHPQQYQSLQQLPELTSDRDLAQTVTEDLAELTYKRQELDLMIISWCEEIVPEDLELALKYTDTKGNLYRKNFGQLVHHFFNHQTHHRGQATTLISQQGLDIGVTDLLQLIPER